MGLVRSTRANHSTRPRTFSPATGPLQIFWQPSFFTFTPPLLARITFSLVRNGGSKGVSEGGVGVGVAGGGEDARVMWTWPGRASQPPPGRRPRCGPIAPTGPTSPSGPHAGSGAAAGRPASAGRLLVGAGQARRRPPPGRGGHHRAAAVSYRPGSPGGRSRLTSTRSAGGRDPAGRAPPAGGGPPRSQGRGVDRRYQGRGDRHEPRHPGGGPGPGPAAGGLRGGDAPQRAGRPGRRRPRGRPGTRW